jgi:hypothetical protein
MSQLNLSSRLFLLAAVLIASLGSADRATALVIIPTNINLVTNGNFDTGLIGWTPVGASTAVTWQARDRNSSSSSGSAAAASPSTQGSNGLGQCVNLPADWRSLDLTLNYSILAPTSESLLFPHTNGNALVTLLYYDAANCPGIGGIINDVEYFSGYSDNQWVDSSFEVTPPALAQSVYIYLGSVNTSPGVVTGLYFDSVFLGYTTGNGCGTDPTRLCLDKNRFQVTAQFSQACATGSDLADGVELSTVGGFLWCFDPGNPEIFVKVLDACAAATGDTYWVFISGLTNLGVTVTVTDTKTGQHKSYSNSTGTAFVSIEDTVGLKVCP